MNVFYSPISHLEGAKLEIHLALMFLGKFQTP
jgi:hypothetical protein